MFFILFHLGITLLNYILIFLMQNSLARMSQGDIVKSMLSYSWIPLINIHLCICLVLFLLIGDSSKDYRKKVLLNTYKVENSYCVIVDGKIVQINPSNGIPYIIHNELKLEKI